MSQLPNPSECVEIYRDLTERLKENLRRVIDTGESIPSQAIVEQLAADWDKPMSMIPTFALSGEMVLLDRMFRNAPEPVRLRRLQQLHAEADGLAQQLGYGNVYEYAVAEEKAELAALEEVEMLNDWYEIEAE